MVAAGVPARGVKGGLARLLHRDCARTERLWAGGIGFTSGPEESRAGLVKREDGLERGRHSSILPNGKIDRPV
jgi:hypothetical protein